MKSVPAWADNVEPDNLAPPPTNHLSISAAFQASATPIKSKMPLKAPKIQAGDVLLPQDEVATALPINISRNVNGSEPKNR